MPRYLTAGAVMSFAAWRAVRRAPFGAERAGRARDAGIDARLAFVRVERTRWTRNNVPRRTVETAGTDAAIARQVCTSYL